MKVMNLILILMSLQHPMTVTRPMTAVVLPVAAAAPIVAAAQRSQIVTTNASQRNADNWKETFDGLKKWRQIRIWKYGYI